MLLISPARAPRSYLSFILIGSLTAALPWQNTRAAQSLSALAWAQLRMASTYPRMVVMHALHKSVRRVYSASLWGAENTMHAVYAIAHHLPCTQQQASKRLVSWPNKNARWEDQQYTDQVVSVEFQPEGYTPAWCADIHLLRQRADL